MSRDVTIFRGPRVPCGGSRAGVGCAIENLVHPGERTIIDVRGSAYGEAFLVGADRIEAVWFTSKLIGTVPNVGRVLFTTRPDAESRVVISTRRSGRAGALLRNALWGSHRIIEGKTWDALPFKGLRQRMLGRGVRSMFLPAFASQSMYFDIHILDAERRATRTLRSTAPMIFEAEITSIPPLGATFRTAHDVDFLDVADEKPTLRMLAGAPGSISDAPGLEMTVTTSSVDVVNGTFNGMIVVRATANAPRQVCWFVTPAMGAIVNSTTQAIDIPFEAPLEIPLSAIFTPGVRSGLVVQCFSSDDTPMETHEVIVFEDQ